MERLRSSLLMVSLLLAFSFGLVPGAGLAQTADESAAVEEATQGTVPGGSSGGLSDAEIWRNISQGQPGLISNPDQTGAVMIQRPGQDWRMFRNEVLKKNAAIAMGIMLLVLLLFYVIRGKIRISRGEAGVEIERFKLIERIGHWITAGSFIVLALTGLNILYGRHFMPDVLGPSLFADITYIGKWIHNWIAFAFMAGLVMIFVMWVAHNIPNRLDLKWLAAGGGMFSKNSHPPAKKFNAGQKIIFWVTIIGGASLSISGWALLNPFQYAMFGGTFEILNVFGFNLPTDLTIMEEQQLTVIWHSVVSVFMIVVIFAHIYIGTVGMQGAFAAMGRGKVDRNWALDHHNLWVEEVEKKSAQESPAE